MPRLKRHGAAAFIGPMPCCVMGGKLKLLRVKHLKYPRGHMHIHDNGLHVTPWIFMSESLSASVTRP